MYIYINKLSTFSMILAYKRQSCMYDCLLFFKKSIRVVTGEKTNPQIIGSGDIKRRQSRKSPKNWVFFWQMIFAAAQLQKNDATYNDWTDGQGEASMVSPSLAMYGVDPEVT